MDLPASYYGKVDKRNPVIVTFERDVNSFITLMRRVVSLNCQDSNGSYAKGINYLVEIRRKYKHRLPSNFYQERMLQVADFLCGIKLHQLALWQGYSLHLLQLSTVKITDITDVDHFMACFFPGGFDTDQDVFNMKVRAMQGCAICIFELEKRRSILSEKGLCKLLRVLDFIRIMMRAFQQHEHLCWQIYNGSIHIYNICRYLMTVNCSAQAMEYLLWASISLELSIPLMTAKYLPWIVTLYCAVCHCYYDNNAAVQAEEFARRALGKINELAKLEEQNEVPATRETQRAYKEASIKLGAMIFKRAVFEGRRKPKLMAKVKIKTTLKDIPNVPWPRTPTERTLMGLFDSSAAQFLGILEALWDSKSLPLQMKVPDEPELLEVILELLSAGISILSGASSTSEQKCDDDPCLCLSTLTSTSTLMDLAIEGENKVPYMSAVRFIKLLYHYKQSEAFAELSTEMIHILSDVEGQSTRKAQMELSLLDAFNSLVCSQRSHPKDDSVTDDRHKSFSMNDEFICLVDTLHKSVCGSAPEVQLDGDLVLDVVFFLWDKVKLVMQRDKLQRPDYINYLEKVDKLNQWLWCLSRLCEVAIACDLATVDCMMVTEMIHILVVLLENAAEHTPNAAGDGVNSFSLLASSSTELLQIVYEMAERGLNALAKGVATLLPQDGSAVTDTAFMQKFCSLTPSTPSTSSLTSQEGTEVGQIDKKEQEEVDKSDIEGSFDAQSRCVALLATDLHLELDIIHHRAYLKLMQLNAVSESELSDRIRKNKVSKALFLIQKALLVHNNKEPNKSRKTKSLLEEASLLIQKAEVEERRLYIAVTLKTPAESKDKGIKEEETPPPPPILLSRTDHSFIFAPAPYKLEGEVCWYQLCGRVAEDINRKVRLGDCSLPGTGNMVPAVSGDCVLRVEGLVPNQKYVFAVAAYNSQGKLLGNTIGGTTFPLLASMSVPLLSTWAHLAQVAFQTQQYALAKRTCRELWSHYTMPDLESHSTQDRLATTRLNKQTVRLSSPHLCQLFLISIFIETEINIQQENLYCNSFSNSEPFIWQQEARLAECERMLVAMDLAMCLNDGIGAVQAVVTCYGLLAPLIFHQITCNPVVQVLKKCLIVLEENSGLLKQNWTGSISESMMHMVACITYYLSKTLRALSEHHVAFAVMDCGRRLIQEVYDAQLPGRKLASEAVGSKLVDQSAVKGEVRISLQLKALHAKNKKRDTSDALTTDNEMTRPQTGCDDPTILYDLICNSTLKDAYQASMKLRHKPFFTEYAALLLQRTMEEGQPDLVLQWGQHMFEFLSRRDDLMGLSTKCLQGNPRSKKKNTTSKGNELSQNKNPPGHDDTRHKVKESKPHSVIHRARSNREMKVVENLLTMMSFVVQRRKKNLQLRNICSEERVWRSHLNYSMAQAHMALVYQSLEQLHGQTPQHRYSHLNPLCFSLAYSGMLLRRNSQQQSFKQEVATERCSSRSGLRDSVAANRNKKKVRADSVTDENCGEGEGWSQTVDSFNKAASHFQRAMVLAHRGGHWTTLQYLCQTVWDHSCRITSLVQLEPQSLVTAEDMNNTTTKLLVLATDLIMDMLNRLELWSLYDRDSTEEELESSLHFSVPLDNSTQVDLRWVRILVLHTLERLHESGKWESLAHFALLFNSYTRERYTLIATPLIVHAQRKLLERISCFGGPAVPQPHHVKTQKVTGKEVTCKSYAECQLLSGWTPNHADQLPVRKKSALKNSAPQHAVMMNDAERQQSMSLVCVPLDVEDTLRHYHQAFERRPQCFHVLQHSRSLLSLLLANTQPCFVPQLRSSESRSLSHSASLVDFSPIVLPTPNTQPSDPTEEEYPSIPNPLYNQPIGSEHMLTVTAAYSTSIKCLQTTNHESLTVQALHEMGNLHFYNGNTRAAHSCWNKAVDCALQTSGVIEKWDGVSFGSGSLQQTLKQAGFWGCLLAAEITAKIAQHILTSDVGQRTKCCLLSAHLFKSLLCCSLAQPQADLQYASHSIGDELLPGVDLFSEPHRVHLGTIITSLNFACHWLFTTGYFITLLPLLAIYLHFVGTVCRDVHRTVEGKILKIRALTELCLFTEATKEAVQLTQGVGVPLTYGHCVAKDSRQPVKTFFSSKSLLDNAQALEELVNCEFTPVVQTLYGSTLCLRLNLARVQLILGLSNTVHGLPVSDSVEVETDGSIKGSSENPDHQDQEGQDSESSTSQQKVLHLDPKKEKLTPERIKFLLLEGASFMLNAISQQLTSQCCSEIEKLEVAVESKLLQVNLYLQQGHTSLSFQTAVSSLVLLQTSPVITTGSASGSMRPKSDRPYSRTRSKRRAKDRSVSDISHGDCPEAVEAGERIGVYLWLHCRLALVRCLAAHIPAATALSPGKNINEEAAKVLQEGLDECASWGDIDIRGLLMVEAAELKALRGKIDDSVEMLQKAVNLLSGLTFRPPGSSVTLARAVLLLSDLRREQSTTLLRLTQKLLLKQLCIFGENVVLQDGKVCFCPPGPNNIYLPYLNILDQITLQTGHIQDLNTMEMSVSAQSLPVQTD